MVWSTWNKVKDFKSQSFEYLLLYLRCLNNIHNYLWKKFSHFLTTILLYHSPYPYVYVCVGVYVRACECVWARVCSGEADATIECKPKNQGKSTQKQHFGLRQNVPIPHWSEVKVIQC